jgi:hypothetical protein
MVGRVINPEIHIKCNSKRKETQSNSNKNYSENNVIHKYLSGFSNVLQRCVYDLLRGLAGNLANKNQIENPRGFS